MTLAELRRRRAELRQQAETIMAQAELTETDATTVRDLRVQDEQLAERIEQLDYFERQRPANAQPAPAAPAHNRGPAGDTEANAWRAYLRSGDRGGLRHLLQPDEDGAGMPQIVLNVPSQRSTRMAVEQRVVTDSTMNITTAGDGGNLVPTTLVGQIALRKNETMLAERLGCRRVPGVGTTVNFPYEDTDPDDMAATSEQSDAYGNNYQRGAYTTALRAFTLGKYTRKVVLTEEMLEDTGVDLMAYIADKIAREMARTHNALLVAQVEANGTAFKTFASNSAIAFGELEDLIGNDTLGFYLENATNVNWVMRSSVHWKINKIVGSDRQYSSVMAGLLGHNVLYSNKVDEIGAGGKSVLFGDWQQMGYREAPALRFIQDPYSVDGVVILKYSFRAVYGVLQAGGLGYGVHP